MVFTGSFETFSIQLLEKFLKIYKLLTLIFDGRNVEIPGEGDHNQKFARGALNAIHQTKEVQSSSQPLQFIFTS